MTNHTAVFTSPRYSPTADEAARTLYGMSAHQLVREILANRDGKFDRLYESAKTKEDPK